MVSHRSSSAARAFLLLLAIGTLSSLVGARASDQTSSLKPQPLLHALETFAAETGLQFMCSATLVQGVMSHGAPAGLTHEETLREIFRDTGLTFTLQGGTIVVLAPVEPPPPVEQIEIEQPRIVQEAPLRMDGSVLAAVRFGHKQIDRTDAIDVSDFLSRNLTMSGGAASACNLGSSASMSCVNLRGLGEHSTLVLIDGRRSAGTLVQGKPDQPDINGIPLAAIERIDVLPPSASAMYGGGAVAGAIDVVLRRDYSGLQTGITYDRTLDSGSAASTVDLGYGTEFDGGRGSFSLLVSHSKSDSLLSSERRFIQRGRDRMVANNPDGFLKGIIPPLGETPNIHSASGDPLFGPDTPSFTSIPLGYTGGEGRAPFEARAAKYNLNPARSAQPTGGGHSLTTGIERISSILDFRWGITPGVEAYLQGIGSLNEGAHRSSGVSASSFVVSASAPGNPFQQPIIVTLPLDEADYIDVSKVKNDRLSAGVTANIGSQWKAQLEHTRSRFTRRNLGAPLLDSDALAADIYEGEIDVLRDLQTTPVDLSGYLYTIMDTPYVSTDTNTVLSFGTRSSREWLEQAAWSFLVEHREERFRESRQVTSLGAEALFPEMDQTLSGAAAQARIPLAKRLEMQFAARHDKYRMRAGVDAANKLDAFSPTITVRYGPVPDATVRMSYGTGFRPPGLSELIPIIDGGTTFGTLALYNLTDPRRDHTPVVSGSYKEGGNPELQPEKSHSMQAGFTLVPRALRELEASIDYYRIVRRGGIANVMGSPQELLDNEARVPSRITRGSRLPGDPEHWAGPVMLADNSLMNIARTELEAVDWRMQFSLPTSHFGRFSLDVLATWTNHLRTQARPGDLYVENVGVASDHPLKLQGYADLRWQRGRLVLGLMARYLDSYLVSRDPDVIRNQGSGRVREQVYCDALMSYSIGRVDVQLTARNVLGEQPPYDAGAPFYFSPFGDPRVRTIFTRVRFRAD